MLTRYDEYPVHQAPYTFARIPSTDLRFQIEGKPTSLQCTVRALASVKDHLEFWPGDPTSPTWYVTIATMVQAIPLVCAAEPGVLLPSVFASSVPDMHLLPRRKSVVG